MAHFPPDQAFFHGTHFLHHGQYRAKALGVNGLLQKSVYLPFAPYPSLSLQPQTGGLRPENHRLPPGTFLPRSQLLIKEDPRGTRLRNHSADAVPFLLFCFLLVPSPLGGLTVLRPIMGSHLHLLLSQKKPRSQVMEGLAFIFPLLSFLPAFIYHLSCIGIYQALC